MKHGSLAIFPLILGLVFGGCGYSLSPTPYGLTEAMTVSVPVAKNQSLYADLGPQLTEDLIARLDASSNINVREGAPATLTMTIQSVTVTGGAWQSTFNDDQPTDSASRVAYLAVEAVLERPGPEAGQPLIRRHVFNGQRTFLVGSDQSQVDLRQSEALAWLVSDLGQKIAQTMFSEF
ncbi:MAG: LPS assembly lipoprotein LptE [Candidatus Adiutrix sp.]|jgi:hypothetical protein|nr:LPS assembly lipoprotein LptE [Candidatus Adiutrix sp.]